ncbi:AT-hook motif nuclear-localized protein 10 [Medicago truncatula]|uniref:AT-hook motif nuclear-localized protein 10 n=1 Tax=Medicago truncatula TaxID=3880 RepID=UPI001967DA54|nr:AT-hook motif nuclear-localized protein 10 [Medicago truncatula]
MEDQNMELQLTLSLGSIPKRSETINNAPDVIKIFGVDVDLITGAKSGGSNSEQVQRGEGRPPKYGVSRSPFSPMTPPSGLATSHSNESEEKDGNGRSGGSLVSTDGFVEETTGESITPYVLIVNPRENVVEKISAFFKNGPRQAVCILAATGAVSNVTLYQPGVSDGFLRYEGHFPILSLNGPCTFPGGCAQKEIEMMSVSLSKPDGSIFGGGIGRSMIAATPIHIVLGTFDMVITDGEPSNLATTSANGASMSDNVTVVGEPSNLEKFPYLDLNRPPEEI